MAPSISAKLSVVVVSGTRSAQSSDARGVLELRAVPAAPAGAGALAAHGEREAADVRRARALSVADCHVDVEVEERDWGGGVDKRHGHYRGRRGADVSRASLTREKAAAVRFGGKVRDGAA